jgi:hypothetical protein
MGGSILRPAEQEYEWQMGWEKRIAMEYIRCNVERKEYIRCNVEKKYYRKELTL